MLYFQVFNCRGRAEGLYGACFSLAVERLNATAKFQMLVVKKILVLRENLSKLYFVTKHKKPIDAGGFREFFLLRLCIVVQDTEEKTATSSGYIPDCSVYPLPLPLIPSLPLPPYPCRTCPPKNLSQGIGKTYYFYCTAIIHFYFCYVMANISVFTNIKMVNEAKCYTVGLHIDFVNLLPWFSFQCPKVVVTEAPPAPIPTPTPTAVEQQRGPQANCSCPSGEKVKPPGFADLYPPAYRSKLERESSSATAFGRYFVLSISHREIQEHPVLQDPRVKRSSDAAFFQLCDQILQNFFSFIPICALKEVHFFLTL